MYCIEVADTHNFFADGVLVSNSFKNLMFSTKMQNVQGLGDSKGSKRAYDMYVKTRQIMDQNGRGQGVVFMTGTPVSNSLAEMYHMMRYLMPEQVKQLGFESFDAWANTFASVNQVWLQKASGDGFKASNRMSSFDNTAELLKLFDQVSDTVTMDDIKAAFKEENGGKEFPLPVLKTGRRQPVSMDKSPALDAYMGEIAKRAAALEARKGPPQKGDDNILVVMGDARKAAMDIRLVDKTATAREPGGRIDRSADEIVSRWKQHAEHRGTQLVFSDMGTPLKSAAKELAEYNEIKARTEPLSDEQLRASADLGDEAAAAKLAAAEEAQAELDAKGRDWLDAIQAALRGFSVYDDLRAALVERGIPAEQVAFIHDFNTDDQKAALFRKVNNGDIRVLIGSTPKMGAGTNVQKRLVALHHLDVPWRPSDVEQREGRIIRQGNMLADTIPGFEVEILAYVTRDTLDMRMWQIQETKLKMINQLRTRQIEREIENAFEDMELSAGEMQAAATGNMDLLKEIQLRTDVQKLEKKQRAFDATRSDLIGRRRRAEQDVKRLPARIEEAQKLADATKEVVDAVAAFKSGFKVTINGKAYTDRAAAGFELRRLDDATETGEDGKEKKAKLSVELNGETYTSRTKMAEAFARLSGDVEPFLFSTDGQTFHRRADAAQAIQTTVADAVAEEARREIGAIGPYKVTVEGQKDKRGEQFVEIVAEAGGQVLDTTVPVPSSLKDPEQLARKVAEDVLKAARSMVWGTTDNLRWETGQLERARKTLADLESTETTEAWPDADRLEKARAAHKEVLQRLSSTKTEAPPAEFSDGAKAQAVAAVEADVAKVREGWANAPEIIVAFDMNDPKVPSEARQDFDKLRRSGAAGSPEGFFLNGKVYLLASQLRTPADAARVLAHEALGHYGLRGVFGNDLNGMLDRLAKALPEKVGAKAKQYGLNMADSEQRRQAAEEYLAELAQTRPTSTWVQALLARVRNWLRENLPGFDKLKMTDADVIAQFIAPARGWVERGRGAAAGPTRFQIVFHGTPHRGIEQFSTDKIGTGEGAQAYGWGLYMASRREVAEFYRKKLTPGGDALRIDGKKPEFDMGAPGGLPATQDGALTNKAILMLQEAQSSSGLDKVLARYADPAVAARARQLLTRATWVPAGQLYEAEIPEDDTMLHWDKPLSEQPEKVRDALAKDADFKDKNTLRGMRDRYGASGNADPTGEQIYNHATLSFHAFDGGLADGTPAGASKYLASLGIKGIKYLDGTSRSAGEGSYNYVIFDGSDAKITKTHFSLADKARAVAAGKIPGGQLFADMAVKTAEDGRLHWWHKSLGKPYNLAQRNKHFKRVFDAVQGFIADSTKYTAEAAQLAPDVIPLLDSLSDIIPARLKVFGHEFGKAPISVADSKMLATTVFHGTLAWTRDRNGRPVKIEDAEAAAEGLDTEQKMRILLRDGKVTADQVQRMQANVLDMYEGWVRNQFEQAYLRPGIVFTPAELKHHFGADDGQIKLYQQFRTAVDRSLTDLAVSDMLRVAGADAAEIADEVMALHDVAAASDKLAQHLRDLGQLEQARAGVLEDAVNSILDKAEKAGDLMARGYAPLMRFGTHTVDVVDQDGERVFFGMFETVREAREMTAKMKAEYPEAAVTRGTLSEKQHELYAGVSPETLELFGEILGLDAQGDKASDIAFQEYLKKVKNQRSAMKRLIHRKGIAGYSEDAGRVLTSFVFSNGRQVAGNLRQASIKTALEAIPKEQGQVRDAAIAEVKTVMNPTETAAAVRQLMFAHYLGGNISSAVVNLTQTMSTTLPYLSQWGAGKAAKELAKAYRTLRVAKIADPALKAALQRADEEGITAPQEIHEIMAQASGRASLRTGDGTLKGAAIARTRNAVSRVGLAWGKPFSWAEMVNRRASFIAAYRTAIRENLGDPYEFAKKVVNETQFLANKGNRSAAERSAAGSVLLTFKGFGIQTVELLNRLWMQGEAGSPERRQGRKAALMMLGMLFLMGGAGGLPFAGDAEDLIDGMMQHLGKDWVTKEKREDVVRAVAGKLAELFGADPGMRAAAETWAWRFADRGVSGLPGAPFDVAGRLGMGNMIPGTGALKVKQDRTKDLEELGGPAWSFFTTYFKAAEMIAEGVGDTINSGDPRGATEGAGRAIAQAAPVGIRNALKGAEMLKDGKYRDTAGNKVVDTTTADALWKMIGFNPNRVAERRASEGVVRDKIALNRETASRIIDQIARGVDEKDDARTARAMKMLDLWNQTYPDNTIDPQRVTNAVKAKVKRMNQDSTDRLIRSAPKSMRGAVMQELREEAAQ